MSQFACGGFWPRIVTALARLRLWYLLLHHRSRPVLVLFALVNSAIVIAILGVGAWWTRWPLIFPSLGPSAFLFFSCPSRPAAWPRSAILGHAFGVLSGWASLWAMGLLDADPAIVAGVDGWRVGAAALSLGAVSALMVAFDCPHPPAASTALIVSLGLMTTWGQLGALMGAVVLLTAQGYVLNRLGGIAYPMWRGRGPALSRPMLQEDPASEIVTTPLATPEATPADELDHTYGRLASKLVAKRGWNVPPAGEAASPHTP